MNLPGHVRRQLQVHTRPPLLKDWTTMAASTTDEPVSAQDAHEIFRRHFEASFLPIEQGLESRPKKRTRRSAPGDATEDEDASPQTSDENEDTNSDSEWSGLSSSEDGALESAQSGDESGLEDWSQTAPVEVVDSTRITTYGAAMTKSEFKAFMVSNTAL